MNKDAFETQLNSSFPQELIDNAISKENFGGEFKFNKMSFIEKTVTKMVCKALAKEDPTFPEVDIKKDMSFLVQDNIKKFIQLMNNAS
jgi:menaquinone-dependent protoporphyrinogen oxidase